MENKLGYVPKEQRKKILLIADDIRVFSGVATVARELVTNTCHHYNYVCIGGAINHPEAGKRLDLSADTAKVSGVEDASVFLYPVSGYGDANLIRTLLKTEKPDAILFVTDPRYYEWLFAIENEVRKQIPMIYLQIWDSPVPYPLFNKSYYESCDLLLAISKQTKNINKVVLGDIPYTDIDNAISNFESNDSNRNTPILLSYLPHGLNHNTFKPLDPSTPELVEYKNKLFKGKEYDFTLFFNSRNMHRKHVPDTLLAFRLFLDKLTPEQAQKCALVMHTEPVSDHGTDLVAVIDYLLADYKTNIYFSTDRNSPETMNLLYNSTDAQILLSSNEGWGLSLTEAILVGNPIVANVQGGMQDQMRFENENGEWLDFTADFPSNHRGTYQNHGEWAFPVSPSNISIQGSPKTPYISDDRCKPEDAAEQIFNVYSLEASERKRRGLAGREWALNEAGFTSEIMGERAIEAIDVLFNTWEPRETFELVNATSYTPDTTRNTKLIY